MDEEKKTIALKRNRIQRSHHLHIGMKAGFEVSLDGVPDVIGYMSTRRTENGTGSSFVVHHKVSDSNISRTV